MHLAMLRLYLSSIAKQRILLFQSSSQRAHLKEHNPGVSIRRFFALHSITMEKW